MGLSLEVGILPDLAQSDEEGHEFYKKQFELVNLALLSVGAGKHDEPDEVEGIFGCDMGGYSTVHCLRRFGAHIALGKPAPPPANLDAAYDTMLAEYKKRFDSGENLRFQHLNMHSDAEGFYVPVDFERVIDAEPLSLSGGYLGSTQRLKAECIELDALLQKIDPPIKRHWFSHPQVRYVNERFATHQLIEACEASVRMKAAIVFV